MQEDDVAEPHMGAQVRGRFTTRAWLPEWRLFFADDMTLCSGGFLAPERGVALAAGGVDAGAEVVEVFSRAVQVGEVAAVHGHGERIGVGMVDPLVEVCDERGERSRRARFRCGAGVVGRRRRSAWRPWSGERGLGDGGQLSGMVFAVVCRGLGVNGVVFVDGSANLLPLFLRGSAVGGDVVPGGLGHGADVFGHGGVVAGVLDPSRVFEAGVGLGAGDHLGGFGPRVTVLDGQGVL